MFQQSFGRFVSNVPDDSSLTSKEGSDPDTLVRKAPVLSAPFRQIQRSDHSHKPPSPKQVVRQPLLQATPSPHFRRAPGATENRLPTETPVYRRSRRVS